MEIQRGEGIVGFHPVFTVGTTRMAELSAVCAGRTLPPLEIPWYPFLLEAEWTTGLLNADRRITSLENFQGFHQKSNPGRPILWRNASTN